MAEPDAELEIDDELETEAETDNPEAEEPAGAVADAEAEAAAEVDAVDEVEAEDVSAALTDADEDEDDEDSAPAESLPQLLEALLFVADEPVAPAALARALELTPRQVRRGLDDLADTLREENRGVRLQQGPDGAQLVTAPEAAKTAMPI